MPMDEICGFDLRVYHQPRAGGKMPVGHGLDDNYVADNDRRGRSGAPGETSMSLALRRRDERWDPGTVVPPGQLECDECGRVFTMNGLWLLCFSCPSVLCCNSCKYRHDAMSCWVVADSGLYTADDYTSALVAFARPCSVHRDRTDLSDQMRYHQCMLCEQRICTDDICINRHLESECPMREGLARHRMNVCLNKNETLADQEQAFRTMRVVWWKESISDADPDWANFSGAQLGWTERRRMAQSGTTHLRRQRTVPGSQTYAQTIVDVCKMIGEHDANSTWTQQVDSQFLSAVQAVGAAYSRSQQDDGAHAALAQNRDVDRVMAMAGRYLMQTAEWVGTSRWTSAQNEMFSSFEQMYAELLKNLKERGNQQRALLAAKEDEVAAAIDKVLKVRAGEPTPRGAQPGSASGAASAAAAGAPGLPSASGPCYTYVEGGVTDGCARCGISRNRHPKGPEQMVQEDGESSGYQSDANSFDAARDDQVAGRPRDVAEEERIGAYVPDGFVMTGPFTDKQFPRTVNGVRVPSVMGMNRYLVLQEKSLEDLQTLLRLAQQLGVAMLPTDYNLIVQIIAVRTGSPPEPCRPPPPLTSNVRVLPKPRRPVPQLPPGVRPPGQPVEQRPPPPESPPPELEIDLMAPLPEPKYDKNSRLSLNEQAWNYLVLATKKAKVDPSFKLPWELTDEQIADPVNLDALIRMPNPYYDGSVEMCAVCNNVLDDHHPGSKKHRKRMEEVQDRNWRISEYGKETIRSRRMQAYNSMLVDRLSWECCSQEC